MWVVIVMLLFTVVLLTRRFVILAKLPHPAHITYVMPAKLLHPAHITFVMPAKAGIHLSASSDYWLYTTLKSGYRLKARRHDELNSHTDSILGIVLPYILYILLTSFWQSFRILYMLSTSYRRILPRMADSRTMQELLSRPVSICQ